MDNSVNDLIIVRKNDTKFKLSVASRVSVIVKDELMICSVCQLWSIASSYSSKICVKCAHEFMQLVSNQIELVEGSHVRVMFRYEGLVRSLIRRTKVKNDVVAAGIICKIAKPLARSLTEADVLVIPSPASFWGRVRGRLDLAELAAVTLYGHQSMINPFIPKLAFRSKRAGRNAHKTSNPLRTLISNEIFKVFKVRPDVLSRISAAERILVVDDVMTTGLTMRTIFSQLKELGAQSVEGLAIASSS